jgi:hypothetical protein
MQVIQVLQIISNPAPVYTSFFDDFASLSNWTTDSGSPSVASSILTVPPNAKIHKTVTNTRPLRIIVKAKISSVVTNVYWISPLNFYASSRNTDYGVRFTTVVNICKIESYDGSDSKQSILNFADNNYHTFELRLKSTNFADFYMDGTLVGTITTNIYSTVNALGFLNDSGSGQTLSVDWAGIAPYTANPPSVGTFGNWEENGILTVSVPSAEGTLTANVPQIVLGGGIIITVPPASATLTATPPTLQAIISSPPAEGILAANAPIIAFLMEVKAGVTYNPDAINDLQRDGVPCNISFNVTIGGQQYE